MSIQGNIFCSLSCKYGECLSYGSNLKFHANYIRGKFKQISVKHNHDPEYRLDSGDDVQTV